MYCIACSHSSHSVLHSPSYFNFQISNLLVMVTSDLEIVWWSPHSVHSKLLQLCFIVGNALANCLLTLIELEMFSTHLRAKCLLRTAVNSASVLALGFSGDNKLCRRYSSSHQSHWGILPLVDLRQYCQPQNTTQCAQYRPLLTRSLGRILESICRLWPWLWPWFGKHARRQDVVSGYSLQYLTAY